MTDTKISINKFVQFTHIHQPILPITSASISYPISKSNQKTAPPRFPKRSRVASPTARNSNQHRIIPRPRASPSPEQRDNEHRVPRPLLRMRLGGESPRENELAKTPPFPHKTSTIRGEEAGASSPPQERRKSRANAQPRGIRKQGRGRGPNRPPLGGAEGRVPHPAFYAPPPAREDAPRLAPHPRAGFKTLCAPRSLSAADLLIPYAAGAPPL